MSIRTWSCGIRAVLARGAIRTHSSEVRIEAMVGSDAALLGVLSQWCEGEAERQRPHSISTWCDETEIRSRSDPVSSFDVHRTVEP